MAEDLGLAVEIADTASNMPIVGAWEAKAKAVDLSARHPESDASVQQIADILREESIDQLDISSPFVGQADVTSEGDA